MTLVNDEEFYRLDPGVGRIWLRDVKLRSLARKLARMVKLILSPVAFTATYKLLGHWGLLLTRVRPVRRAIASDGAPVVISFIGSVNVITILACIGRDTRTIISERNDPALQRLHAPWQLLRRKLYRYADTVTANSHGALETMRDYVPAKKLHYVPNPLVPAHDQPSQDPFTHSDAPVFLIVARLDAQKAHAVLLNALALLPPTLYHWRLAIVGSGSEESALRKLASRLGISGRLDWYGQVTDPFSMYQTAEIMVLPSYHEGMPNAVLEAMRCGLPVIVSDCSPGLLEIVDHQVNGLVVRTGSAPALAAAMSALAGDDALRSSMGQAARVAAQPFALDTALAEWNKVINQTTTAAPG